MLARHLYEAESLVADGGGHADTVFVEGARRYRYVGPHEFDNGRRSGAVVRVGSPAAGAPAAFELPDVEDAAIIPGLEQRAAT